MVLISFTNCVVDEFNYGKDSADKYLYFLTHMHADHYWGITPGRNYKAIYCSNITKKILLNKFPTLKAPVIALPLDKKQTIILNEENQISIEVQLFDSNHTPGSVMFLFEGYMGRILNTGDMRWNNVMFEKIPYLFPNPIPNFTNCSIDIDEVIFDNTFCDPMFVFPLRSVALKMIVQTIDEGRKKGIQRVFICVDTLGKEEIMVVLGRYYQTLIVVNEDRYSLLECVDGIDIN